MKYHVFRSVIHSFKNSGGHRKDQIYRFLSHSLSGSRTPFKLPSTPRPSITYYLWTKIMAKLELKNHWRKRMLEDTGFLLGLIFLFYFDHEICFLVIYISESLCPHISLQQNHDYKWTFYVFILLCS